MKRTAPLTLSVLATVWTPSAFAQEAVPDRAETEAVETGLGVDASLEIDPARAFGAAGTSYWGVTTGVGFALEEDDDALTSSNRCSNRHAPVTAVADLSSSSVWRCCCRY